MYSDIVKSIERKYESKRIKAEKTYEENKRKIYIDNPRLAEIEKEIALCGIRSAKLAITGNNANNIEENELKLNLLKSEKGKILSNLKFDSIPNFECKKCLDTGYITTSTGTQMCSCFKQQLLDDSYNRSNLHNLKLDTFEKYDDKFYSDKIDVERYGVNISPKDNINKIKNLSENFINNFDDPNQKNLLFTGSSGSGKTFLSSCIANELLKKNYNVLYQTAPLLFDSIFEYKYAKQNVSSELYDTLFNVDLLIIDDLGAESITDAKITELFNILNSRLISSNTKTIISTNLTPQKLAASYDLRIMSRIVGNYDICMFFGDDLRLIKR